MTDRLQALPYYRWHWQSWRANRAVQRMSYVERGIYRELLDECWAEGGIPNDIAELADIVGCPEQVMADAWQVLSKCFADAGNGFLINERLDKERTDKDEERAKRALAGKSGGIAKSLNSKEPETSAKQVLADASKCHIEEKRREEERKEEKSIGEAAPARPARKSKKTQETTIPENFTVSDRVKNWAKEHGHSDNRVSENFAKFALWAKSKGKTYSDWDSALMGAIRDNWAKAPEGQQLSRHGDFDQRDYHAGADKDGKF